jgi:hypothetical protein
MAKVTASMITIELSRAEMEIVTMGIRLTIENELYPSTSMDQAAGTLLEELSGE